VPCKPIVPGVTSVGSVDWDRRLFDELVPLPDGTSYNAYLIQGTDKVALLDTVDPPKFPELLAHLARLGIGRIDYLIAHHAEQDHSGSLPEMLHLFPGATLVSNGKCLKMLADHLHVPAERCREIADGETLELGGKTLEFLLTPWVHWPETMLTYLRQDKVLFSCDLFGAHLAQSDPFLTDPVRTATAARRYYAEIMMPFRSQIRKHMERLAGTEIAVIAPSHGVVYRDPAFILDLYRDWVSDRVQNRVLLPFVSMHGSTRRMVEHLTEALSRRDVEVEVCNLTATELGHLASALVDAATVVIGTPMVLAGAHPAVVEAAYLVNALRPKTRFVGLIGSYGWGGKMVEQITGMLSSLKAEVLEPVLVQGLPGEKTYEALDRLADGIAERHRQLG